MGFAKDWVQILAMRVVLGVFAAGYFPGCVYLLSCWYTRCECLKMYIMVDFILTRRNADEVQKRFSVFYGVGCIAQALAGILAFGLMQMDGAQGYAGWRWIFIIEGAVRLRFCL